jgi:hypothetical protein
MNEKLDGWLAQEAYDSATGQFQTMEAADRKLRGHGIIEGSIYDEDFDMLLVQLSALGLITKSERKRIVSDKSTYWTLTPYGDNRLTALRAIRRTESAHESSPADPETS